ncbi:MAG: DUF4382 domain-containing protein [Gammaproteobacteria bacterium]|nr:DUF4382 domain-containing protein [Gammaproteobacteria bacterium]
MGPDAARACHRVSAADTGVRAARAAVRRRVATALPALTDWSLEMRHPRPFRPAFMVAAATCGLAAIAGCTSRTDVGATGTAPADATHLWGTVQEVWFATAAETLPDSQTGWTRRALSKPVVLDLATASSSTLVALGSSLSLPSGTYKQMHLELADSWDRLVGAASDAGLDYNAQIDLADGSGAKSRARLELPVPGTGLTVPVDLAIRDRTDSGSSGSGSAANLSLAITIDAARDVVRYDYGSNKGYLLTPYVSVDDEDSSGTLKGSVDASALPAGHPPITVSAEVRTSSGSHRVVVQRRQVAADGSFILYPLPGSKSGKKYDVVITCAGADTVIVRDVPVTAGSAASPTTVQSTPIVLAAARTVYANATTQSPALPAGTRVEFYQTRPGSDGVPYLVDGTAVDPISRQLPHDAFALAAGSLVVGTYAGGNTIAFATETPAEGSGGYVVGSAGQYRSDTLARNSVDVGGGSNRPTIVAVPYPAVASAGISGTLTVNVQAPVGRFDSGFIALSSGSRLMETASVGALLERGSGIVTIAGLPAGTGLVPGTGVPYRVSLRAWNSRNAVTTLTVVSASTSVVLGDVGTASTALVVQ